MVAPGVVRLESRSHDGAMPQEKDSKAPPPKRLDEIFGPDPVVGVPEHQDRDTDDREAWYRENRPPHHDPR